MKLICSLSLFVVDSLHAPVEPVFCPQVSLAAAAALDGGEFGVNALLGGSVYEDEDAAALNEEELKNAVCKQTLTADANRSKRVIWQHMHHAAGTNICHEAIHQGEHVPTFNCHRDGQERVCSCIPEEQISGKEKWCKRSGCEGRKSMPWSFAMLERGVDDNDFCEGYIMGTMLRDPIKLATTTANFDHYKVDEIVATLKTKDKSHISHGGGICLPEPDSYHHFDNFITRSLSNHYDADVGEVSQQDFDVAKERLAKFDIVLILEELSEHVPQLKCTLGWDTDKWHNAHAQNGQIGHDNHHANKPEDFELDPEVAAFMRKANHWDYKLIDIAKGIAANLTKRATC